MQNTLHEQANVGRELCLCCVLYRPVSFSAASFGTEFCRFYMAIPVPVSRHNWAERWSAFDFIRASGLRKRISRFEFGTSRRTIRPLLIAFPTIPTWHGSCLSGLMHGKSRKRKTESGLRRLTIRWERRAEQWHPCIG